MRRKHNKFKLYSLALIMDEQGVNYSGQLQGDTNLRIKDLEEKQSILKDRLLLIGNNLIETKEETNSKILMIRKDIEEIKNTLERTKIFLEAASSEFSKFARKEDLEILMKQAKMFQPLEFVRKSELKKMGENK